MRFLIVEDERDICDTLVEYLCEREHGNTCDHARSMESAQRKIDRNQYDVILLDFMIRGKESSELIDRARARYGRDNVVIILISAWKGAEEAAEQKECEFFMGKPFELETIDEIIFVKCKKRFDDLTHLR